MALEVTAVQVALEKAGIDGWLLYDFHGSNPIAAGITQVGRPGTIASRRWYYLIPSKGEPRGLVHAIERHNLDRLPGSKHIYAGRRQLEAGLKSLLAGMRTVAMEYSPGCAIPYISRVDAGTIEAVRAHGITVVSSGDLVQQFEAVWDADALESHRVASERLYRIKDQAFAAVSERLANGRPTTEFEIQQLMAGWFRDEGLVTDSDPVVAAQEHSGDPHYLPSAASDRAIRRDEVLLLDLWGKLDRPGAVFADITWVGFTGRTVPEEVANAFGAIATARDEAVRLVQSAAAERRELHGWEVDRTARQSIETSGYGDRILHRTGHSLGTSVHGNGVHMDDYETHDDRRLIPGTGFTIEPGVYFPDFGVRTEINMYFGERQALVTGPVQASVRPLQS
jgi:Xaa-Pro aminopeptidase